MVVDFNKNYHLENERVLLRPLTSGDHSNLLHFSLHEPELWKFSLQSAAGTDNLTTYIRQALEARAQMKEYPFIVFDKMSQTYAGCTRFYDILPAYATLQLGYTWYGQAYHGTGLNKNCKYLLMEFAFEQLLAERLEFRADNDNARSTAAMKSIGCKVDGILRSNMPKPLTGRRDSIVLSILKDEWFSQVKKDLASKIQRHT